MKTTQTEAKQGRVGVLADRDAKIARLEQELATERARVADLQMVTAELEHLAQGAQLSPLVAFAAGLPAKKLHRALALACHPDHGGETATMQALNAAWSATRG